MLDLSLGKFEIVETVRFSRKKTSDLKIIKFLKYVIKLLLGKKYDCVT